MIRLVSQGRMMRENIVRSNEDECRLIHECLQDYNREYMDNGKDYSFHIEFDGVIAAGIVAESVEDTLEISYLFVRSEYRGRGLGTKLVCHIESLAKENGIRRIFLNTYSFQAPGFYRHLGYREILCIDPVFGVYRQHYFVKELQ